MPNPILGPCLILAGDPTIALGAGMIYLGPTRGDVSVDPGVEVASARSDQTGRSARADSAYTSGARPTASVPLYQQSITQLNTLIMGSVAFQDAGPPITDALGFGGGPNRVALIDIPTVVFVPVDQRTDGVDAADAIWFPAAMYSNGGAWTFNLPEGDDAGNVRNVEVRGAYRDADHASTAIPLGARNGWYGPPVAVGLTWLLPDLTGL